jgi:hypothetical protein
MTGGLWTWDEQGCQDSDADPCRNVSSQVPKEAMAGNNATGVDYQTVGRMALSAMKGETKSRTLPAVRTSATYNFMWTRLTFSEMAADGFGVIRKAVN